MNSRILQFVGFFVVMFGLSLASHVNADEAMLSHQYPWTTVGRVETETGTGSGVLVAKDLAVTAKHVVVDDAGNLRPNIRFAASKSEIASFLTTDVLQVWYSGEDSDWAVLRLRSPIGELCGWLGLEPRSSNELLNSAEEFTIAGYRVDRYQGITASIDKHVHVLGEWSQGYETDANSWNGSSGAPIFGSRNNVIGIHVAALSNGRKAMIPASHWAAKVNELRDSEIGKLSTPQAMVYNVNPSVTRSVRFVSGGHIVGNTIVPPGTTRELFLPTYVDGAYVQAQSLVNGHWTDMAKSYVVRMGAFNWFVVY